MNEKKERKHTDQPQDANRDPLTGAPGAHPVGTGLGAAAGGAAGVAGAAATGAAMGTAVGPAGTIAGAAVGAVVGGLAGKGIAEKINPTEEDAYWREHHSSQPYYTEDYTFDDYAGAYRTGYEGWGRHGASGRTFEDLEPEFRSEYERNWGNKSRVKWDQARNAARAAWERVINRRLEDYVGYDVVDRQNQKIGTLECIWSDATGNPEFIGVKTGWFLGKTHVVPAHNVQVSQSRSRLRLPYDEKLVKDAPSYASDLDMSDETEREVNRHYGVRMRGGSATGQTPHVAHGESAPTKAGTAAPSGQAREATPEQATIQLSEEQLKIGKREVEVGGVRLRKIVRTEVVHQPVELQREELVIERVPASEAHTGRQQAFNEQEVFIPLRREEAVVEKTTALREEVRARKATRTDRQEVSAEVRREDVEVEESGEAKRRKGSRPGRPGETIRDREEQPRSLRRHEG